MSGSSLREPRPFQRRPHPTSQGRRSTVARRAVADAGLYVGDLAAPAGAGREHVSGVINGRTRGSAELWRRLAAVLDVDPAELQSDGWAL